MNNRPMRPFTKDGRRPLLAFIGAFALILGFRLIEFNPNDLSGWIQTWRFSGIIVWVLMAMNLTHIDSRLLALGQCRTFGEQVEKLVAKELKIAIVIGLGFQCFGYALLGLFGL